MKKLFPLFLLSFSISLLHAQTNVSGNQSGTWTKANSPYVITGTAIVPAGQTLTIDAGVTVEITTGGIQLDVQGTLNAVGTNSDSIYFLRNGGFSGNQISPIYFEASSQNSVLNYVKIDGLGFYYNNDGTYILNVNSTSLTISKSTIQNSRGTAVGINETAKPIITNNAFLNNSNFDVVNHPDELKNISGNDSLKIGLYQNQVAISTTDTLKSSNYYYAIINTITIPLTKTLVINPGTKVEIETGDIHLIVQGTLKAAGVSGNNIQFTTYGGYSGNQITPITFETTSQNSICQYTTFDGLGFYYNNDLTAVISIRSSSCKIDNCIIQNTRGTGIIIGKGAKPTISNNTFSGNANLDVVLDPDKIRNLTGNNPLNIGLTDSIPMALSDTLVGTNLLYRLLNTLTIPPSKMLTVNPGVIVQIPSGGTQLIVQGTLNAKGSADNYAQFVRLNGYSGNQQTPIIVDTGSINTLIKYVIIDQFGYYYNNNSTTTILIKSSSCNFTNAIVQNSRGVGVEIENCSPTFTQSCFYSNSNGAVLSISGNPTFFHCNFSGNTSGINNTSATDSVYARNCYWGDALGPLQSITNPTGVGDSVSSTVVYQPFASDMFNCSEEVMPVALLNFKATYSSVKLISCAWQTTSENNSDYFTIQRSTNAINFSDIGKINAAGTSTAVRSYSYADNTFSDLGANRLYYRLEEVDHDGRKQFSNIATVDIGNNKLFVYPVPANNIIHISLPQPLSQNASVSLYNINGKMVISQKIISYSLNQQLNVAGLAAGNYKMVIADNGKKISTTQIVIMH